MNELEGARVAFLVANEGVEQRELTEPWEAVRRAGATPVLIAPDGGDVQCFEHLDRADTAQVDVKTADADASDYDALVLPGGVANADELRTDHHAVRFVRQCFEHHKPVGVICHGPWILADAGVLDGRVITSWPSLKTDLHNAGATWIDAEVQVDGSLVSSRKPDDLPAFCREIVQVFATSQAD
jgi:protease I